MSNPLMDVIGQSYISNQESINYDLNREIREEAIKSVRENTEFIILTPFNLNIGKKSEQVRSNNIEYHNWLDSRIKIFNKHTINSIKSQVIEFDEWGVLLEYPYDIRETIKIKEMIKGYDKIKPYYMSGEGKDVDEIEYEIRPNRINNKIKDQRKSYIKKYMATTRLDSDDKLSAMYMYNLIKALYFLQRSSSIQSNEHYLFNMPYGLKEKMVDNLDIVDKKQHYFGDNCFTTLLAPWSSSKNVFSFPHDVVPRDIKKIDIITREPAWSQIVHEKNIINSW